VYTPTPIRDASPRSEALSEAVRQVIDEHRRRDPQLGAPEALVALELAKTSLLQDAIGPAGGRRTALMAGLVLAALATGLAFFLLQP